MDNFISILISARKIKPQNCWINWAEESVLQIDRKFRAFYGFVSIIFFNYWLLIYCYVVKNSLNNEKSVGI